MFTSPRPIWVNFVLWWLTAVVPGISIANPANPDSLSQLGFGAVQRDFFRHRNNKSEAVSYAQIWLSKAKQQNNHAQQMQAYKALAYAFSGHKIQYAYIDSMVAVAQKSKNNALIGAAFLSKGISLYQDLEHQQALDNYLIADAYIAKTKDEYQSRKVHYQIAQTKYQLGFYHEAVALLKPCVAFFEDRNDRAYLNSLYALSLCYNNLGNFNQAAALIKQGKDAAQSWEIPVMVHYFTLSEAMNCYGLKEYGQAAALAQAVLPYFASVADKSNSATANFVAGRSNVKINRFDAALQHFKNIDTIFSDEKYIRPELLEGYEYLVNYYKEKGQATQALYYANRWLRAEKTAQCDYKYLSSKILRKYDPRQLQRELLATEKRATIQKWFGSGIIGALMFGVLGISYRYRKQRKQYHDRFEQLMKKKTDGTLKSETAQANYNENALGFSEELAQKLLKRLTLFETRHEYIESDMSLQKLAAKLNTNQKYITRLLAHYRGKGTIEYIANLKIDYIVAKLQTNKKLRRYTNKALGQEVGFGSTQIFTRSFKARVGMPPTIFIAELNKSETGPTQ